MTTRRRQYETSSIVASHGKEEKPKDVRSPKRVKEKHKLNKGPRNSRLSAAGSSCKTQSEADGRTHRRPTNIKHDGSCCGFSPSAEFDLQQDIFWDPTSPTLSRLGKGTRKLTGSRPTVEISELVNRIAPKDEKPPTHDIPLFEMWLGENAIPCTPGLQRARPLKKSKRKNNVEDLIKLAKQFDKNMTQQDKKQSSKVNHKHLDHIHLAESSEEGKSQSKESVLLEIPNVVMNNSIKSLSQHSVDPDVEAFMNEIFDGPTQHASGSLSQNSSSSSQDQNTSVTVGVRQTKSCTNDIKHESNETSGFENKESLLSTYSQENPSLFVSKPKLNKCELLSELSKSKISDGFDEDWDSDDLINDSFIIAVSQNPEAVEVQKENCILINESSKTNLQDSSKQNVISIFSDSASQKAFNPANNRGQNPEVLCVSGSNFQQFKSKTEMNSNKTFMFNSSTESLPLPSCVLNKGSLELTDILGKFQGDKSEQLKPTAKQSKSCKSLGSLQENVSQSDNLWDDVDDDELLYQLCDDVEKLTDSQSGDPRRKSTNCVISNEAQVITHSKKLSSFFLPKDVTQSRNSVYSGNNDQNKNELSSAHKHLFNRSYSYPGKSTCLGNAPSKGIHCLKTAINKQVVSEILTSETGTSNCSSKRAFTSIKGYSAVSSSYSTQNVPSGSRMRNEVLTVHNPFKRHLSDPVALTSKVIIPDDKSTKCSQLEIELKKQMALERRKQRQQVVTQSWKAT
ncbi:ewing's tumor-associated antigen 1-like isoform X1 [Erpetoichthys calabaricus]|uniref:ewing's tumor-associated antigen 1-like isoform X1 n=1 Tax=Erpetoichthys calabaricus TaxID=27687 RepID=UPI002234CE2F|nr:ewing's tumor-associated antigen 1-like isoform X1 [Erpetoichthys calabaricus]